MKKVGKQRLVRQSLAYISASVMQNPRFYITASPLAGQLTTTSLRPDNNRPDFAD
jgi:hypothetical protein